MHVLVTTDTLSGLWTYTQELVTGLANRGVKVTLVSFGDIPLPEQTSWMSSLEGLEYHPTAFRLHWMQEGEFDLRESSAYLTELVREIRPDLLHLNHVSYGSLRVDTPRIVVAHGDYVSWWRGVHGRDPKESRWLSEYRETMIRGLQSANATVAPSKWMLETIRGCYVRPRREMVIYNGRNPTSFNPYVSKEKSVLAVGRMWDAGKQVSLLTRHSHPLPLCIVGGEVPVAEQRTPIRADVKVETDNVKVAVRGAQTEAQMRVLYSRASIYVATARYEPFGMAALEAAFSRCAIVANDIPSFREIWGEAALYFQANDSASLASTIQRLHDEPDLCRMYALRSYQRARECFTARRMVDEYLRLYHSVSAGRLAAA
jgi:glycosyltransferase involved in cell wall biosynthesis